MSLGEPRGNKYINKPVLTEPGYQNYNFNTPPVKPTSAEADVCMLFQVNYSERCHFLRRIQLSMKGQGIQTTFLCGTIILKAKLLRNNFDRNKEAVLSR